jgi:hypothetical protein
MFYPQKKDRDIDNAALLACVGGDRQEQGNADSEQWRHCRMQSTAESSTGGGASGEGLQDSAGELARRRSGPSETVLPTPRRQADKTSCTGC